MENKEPCIAIINGGSSSIKFSVVSYSDLHTILDGKIDHLGTENATIAYTNTLDGTVVKKPLPGSGVYELLIEVITSVTATWNLVAIGHRIVHGGTKYYSPHLVDTEMLTELEHVAPFAPQHLPAQIALLTAFQKNLANVPQIACFDTGFFHNLPRMAQIIPIPRKYESEGVRRYGFHGLSYEYLLYTLTEVMHVSVHEKKIVLAHLGNGASVTAVQNGNPIDTTMGFTPTSGIPMGTRSGDLDPGLFEYFTQEKHMTPPEFNHMVNFESGLLGISASTSDMEVLLEKANTDAIAEEAVSFFCYQVQKSIGALSATMNGIDILVFTGGMGEQSSSIRRRICANLAYLGISLNVITNATNSSCISDKDSRVILYVVPTNEAHTIARHTKVLLTEMNGPL